MNDDILVLDVSSAEEARKNAAAAWNLDPDDITLTVIEEGKAFFGLLGKRLKVEARPSAPLYLLRGRDILNSILGHMDLNVDSEIVDGEGMNLLGPDAGIVIGKYGETLKAMEYLLNLVARGADEGRRIVLDSDGYRERREQSLQRMALAAARKCSDRGRPVHMEPMTSWERRIVHLTLKDSRDVETRSMGDPPSRKVVVYPRSHRRDY
ncbi:MAG: RNA-binding cell elongation regulator Jag/EloR [Synergistota bacterium]|nr:RNA-binding cell elongation regulator Jag/EloR [Synergistota bacterium]OPZ40963.1 MAG: R3H domain protein [Synergistetes bacterium ADurb.BinA166]